MKRRLFKLALFLLLGAIVNVAVAWGWAKWIRLDHTDFTLKQGIDFRDGNDWRLSVTQSNGTLIIYSVWDNLERERRSHTTLNTATSLDSMHFTFIHPPEDKQLELPRLERLLTAYGWPKLSLWSGYEFQNPYSNMPTVTIKSGIRISGDTFYRFHTKIPWTLPLHPIWPGFAINTIFYSAILWLLILAPFTARQMIRRKRGRCIKCGYDLRGRSEGGCSECGWGREKTSEQVGSDE